MEEKKSFFQYTDEEIISCGKMDPNEPLDFSYPEGLFKLINSIDTDTDLQIRKQMVYGLLQTVMVM